MLESKELVTEHRESIPRMAPSAMVVRAADGGRYTTATITPIFVQEGKPIIVDIKEFQYAYKCSHYGHEWSETHVESRRET